MIILVYIRAYFTCCPKRTVRCIVQGVPTRGSRPHFVNCTIKYRTIIRSLVCATYCESYAFGPLFSPNGWALCPPHPKKMLDTPALVVGCVRDVIVPVLIFGRSNRKRSPMDINDVSVACTAFWGRRRQLVCNHLCRAKCRNRRS